MSKQIQLKGRVFLTFNIRAVSGLHIGGSDVGVEIGGVDKTVIRDPLTNRPYIPGSSLKGKVRSLLEKYDGLPQNQRIGQGYIHSCDKPEAYAGCAVCQVFGVPGERDFGTPTRLVVRDVQMTEESAVKLETSGRTDLPYTEIKTEVSIDRVTSAANPRQMERVPAGAVFGLAEMVYSIYDGEGCDPQRDVAQLAKVVEGLVLLEDDYLGGLGSRGSGKVRLEGIEVSLRSQNGMLKPAQSLGRFDSLDRLVAALPQVQEQIRSRLAQA
ncbi:MAG: type III-A CRISPR-associated RAMP protein Csm3 [Caldilinea sp.]|jgi:CRISPR-associated protein Csm3|uniref:type III-A CRISPR-associated RAMP protein Csm3 n=1 Tax=Caldilinea sp. TaxID=2293560 RepID=UPI0030B63990